ncbi:MAG: hypothetical protein JST11_31830 [Acidobacteria bacterium]|nr:hypothetical protein [Acidobacteriota bacterium]
MNIGIYFQPGIRHAIVSQFLLWKDVFRPMGAAFYLPIYYLFGLNPAAFQAAITLILLANAWLIYRFVKSLGAEAIVAALVTLIGCYHTGLTNLQYNVDMIYDVLCFFFYLAALNYYTSIRLRGRRLNALQVAVFLALYLCALNSKEMAVTLPVLLVCFEGLYCRPKKMDPAGTRAWLGGAAPAIALSIALNLLYIYGKALVPHALATRPAYAPVFTLTRVIDFQRGSLTDLFMRADVVSLWTVVLIWVVATTVAWFSSSPLLRFCWFMVLLTPLPIEFLSDRFQGCLYIPMVGWTVLTVSLFLAVLRGVVAFLPAPRVLFAAGIAATVVAVAALNYQRKLNFINPAAYDQGRRGAQVLSQLRALNPHVKPHSTVVFLHDPFIDWDMYFIANLFFRDRTVHVCLQRLNPLPPADVERAAAIFDFQKGQLVQVK